MSPTSPGNDFIHKEYPRQFKRNEFWNQIKRTVNGKPVSETDIRLIADQITRCLDLNHADHVLDLGCGNAALASRFFNKIRQYTGVDFSEYLLGIASEFFQPHSNIKYIEADIRSVELYLNTPDEIDKVLIYGSIAYLTKSETEELIRKLKSTFPNLCKIFIGNVPNQNKAEEFFAVRKIEAYELEDPQSPIGVWWEEDEFVQLGDSLGFQTDISHMPAEFYGGKYRFDVVLQPR